MKTRRVGMKFSSFCTIGIFTSLTFCAMGFFWSPAVDPHWNTLCFSIPQLAIFALLAPFSVLAFIEIAAERQKNPAATVWLGLKFIVGTAAMVQLCVASYIGLMFSFSCSALQIIGWLFFALVVITTRWFSDALFPGQSVQAPSRRL